MQAAHPTDVKAPSRFELRRRLGAGAMGVVYEAVDRRTGTPVALKTLHALGADALYRLKREFRMLQRLHHGNLCQLHELLEHQGRWFVSMELVRGQDFLGFVRSPSGGLDLERLRTAWSQLAEGLSALHDARLVHRDIKPSNVLVTPAGRVVVVDFGFVSDTDAIDPDSRAIVGTPAYMAPEQAMTGAVGPAADWYSVGVLVYQAMTGRLPHAGETAVAVLLERQRLAAPSPRSCVPDLPADLAQLCSDLLAFDPGRRPDGRRIRAALGASTAARPPAPEAATASAGAFVGRRRELDALRSAFQDAGRGRPATVLVTGQSGVGKSALVRQFTRTIGDEGATILHGRCYQRESVPYKAWDGVVDELGRHLRNLPEVEAAASTPHDLGALLRMFPVLGAVTAFAHAVGHRARSQDPQEQRNRAFSALRELCQRLAARRPLVIVIDDWQWADHDSVLLARDLVGHRESPPILLVVSAQPPADAETAARIDAVAAGAHRVELGPLGPADASELARGLLLAFAPSADVRPGALADEAQGHPFYIAELVRHVASHGDGERRGMRLEDAIAARIVALPPQARAIVDALAVAGGPLPDAVVRAAVALAPSELQAQAAVLRMAHLIRSTQHDDALEPYHDRVRAAALGAMAPAAQVGWHARLAAAIEASPLAHDRPELLAHHLEAAGEGSRAVELAITAAQRSYDASAFDRASTLYRTALRVGHFEPARLRALRVQLADSLGNAGHSAASATVFLEALDGAEPSESVELRRQAAMQLLSSGDLEGGLALLSGLLREVGLALPASPRRALAAVAWGRARLWLRGLTVRPTPDGRHAPDALRRLDVLHAVSHGLSMLDNIRGADFNTRWLLAALRAGEPVRSAMALATEAVYLGSQGARRVAKARALVDEAGRLADELGDAHLSTWHLVSRGTVEYWACQLPAARDSLLLGEARWLEMPRVSWAFKNYSRMFLVYALRQMGTWHELRQRLGHYMAEAERCGDRYVLGSMRRYDSVLQLASDDPEGAARMVDSVPWPALGTTFHVQHWCELEARAEIGLYQRNLPAVAAHLASLWSGLRRSMLGRVHTLRLHSLWLRARLALARAEQPGDQRRPVRIAARLASALAREGDPRAELAARLVAAAVLRGRGDDDAAAGELRRAIATGTASSLRLLTAVAQRRLGELVGGDEGAALVAASAATFDGEHVVSPERFAGQYAPGPWRR